MKICYIAGKYSGETFVDVDRNVVAARDAALTLATLHIPFFCPIIHTAHFETYLRDGDPGYEFWIAMTMEMLKRCDAVLALKNWRESRGATGEVEWATRHAIPVFESIARLAEWHAENGE